MKVLFVSGDAHLPQTSGGVQSSTDQLLHGLIDRGHEASLLCALHGGNDWFAWRSRLQKKLTNADFSYDGNLGYPVYRSWAPWEYVDQAIAQLKPEVALIQHNHTFEFLRDFTARGVPCVVYLRNVEFYEISGDLGKFKNASFIANSRFTAAAYSKRYGINCLVIPPSIDPQKYSVESDGDKVVFINPSPLKGVDLAVEIAAVCPDLPFWFVESWPLTASYQRELEAKIAKYSNIQLIRRTADMREIYRFARLVLVPSKWEEAWGRVASEAHVSGIPVIGSDRGGLPEAVGPAGITLPYDAPVDDWASAVRTLYNDAALHSRLSEAAKSWAIRDELNIDSQIDLIVDLLKETVARKLLQL